MFRSVRQTAVATWNSDELFFLVRRWRARPVADARGQTRSADMPQEETVRPRRSCAPSAPQRTLTRGCQYFTFSYSPVFQEDGTVGARRADSR